MNAVAQRAPRSHRAPRRPVLRVLVAPRSTPTAVARQQVTPATAVRPAAAVRTRPVLVLAAAACCTTVLMTCLYLVSTKVG